MSVVSPFPPPDPSSGGRPRSMRRRTRLGVVAMVAVLALVGAACYQLDENNRANPVFGASNGQLGSERLVVDMRRETDGA